jgi:hypothetical protein
MRCSNDLVGRSRSAAQTAGRQPAELGAEFLRRTHQERLELVDGGDSSGQGRAPGGQQHPQRLVVAPLADCSQLLGQLAEGVTGSADGVDRIGLGAAALRRPLGSASLDQMLTAAAQEGGQARAVAAGALDRPAAPASQMDVGEAEQGLVAGRVGAHGGLAQDAADRAERGGGQTVAVGVNADHAIDELCQHGHGVSS